MAGLPRPGSTARWILTIGVVVVLLITAFVYYNRMKDEQAQLLDSIAQSDQTIATFREIDLTALENEAEELERRASSATARQNTLSSSFKEYTHSIEIGEQMYRAAAEAGVTITSLTCDGPQNAEAAEVVFETYAYSVEATSEVPPQLLNFLQKISDTYETGTIESLSMSLPQPNDEGVVAGKATLSLRFKVYYLSSSPQALEPEEGATDGA